MGRIRLAAVVGLFLGILPAVAGVAGATVLPPGFVDTVIGSALQQPVNFDFLPDGRVLIVERATGRIRLARPGAPGDADTVGVVSDLRTAMQEQGLLGIAVDPRWPALPYIYVHYTSALSPNIKLTRFALTGDLTNVGDGRLALDESSRRDIIADLPDDQWLHNGGTLMFGPDGYLYDGLGDDAWDCSAQDIHQLRGKILRLNPLTVPAGPGPAPLYDTLVPPGNPFATSADSRARLVWHSGLRNPWAFDFNWQTGRMVIADVGFTRWEEIDLPELPARNFGWPFFEGDATYDLTCENPDFSRLTAPAFTYGRDSTGTGIAIMLGGWCFEPPVLADAFPPEYWNQVFYFDLFQGRLRRLDCSTGTCEPAPPVAGQPAEDAWGLGFENAPRMRFHSDGGLWYVQGSEIHRIRFESPVGVPRVADRGLEFRAYPVPTTGAVNFDVAAGGTDAVTVAIHDLAGRVVRRISAGAPGAVRLAWDGRDETGRVAPAGVYFARCEAGARHASRRLIVLARR